MELPARPFIGRLLAEIAKLDGGVPAAAEAMGVDPRIISELANGDLPSPQELRAICAWLVQRTAMTRQEAEDYERLRATSSRKGAELERAAPRGGVLPRTASRRYLPSLPQMAGGLVILVLAVVLSVLVTTTIVKAGNSGTAAGKTASPGAEPSPSATESGDAAATPSPASSSAPASPPDMNIFRSDHISIAEVDSNLNGGGSYYKNLSVNPPVTTTNFDEGDVDVLIGGSPPSLTMQADNGTSIGMWHQSVAPIYPQCLQAAEAGGVGQIDISQGQIVCVETSSGAVAALKLMSISGFDSADFSGTIWYPSHSP
jgi:hypothetical protein